VIEVLLSTHNGDAYLPALLDSLLGQEYPDLHLVVRDDGSQDRTVKILGQYASRFAELEVHQGHHIGALGSFSVLLRSEPAAELTALCDQDDVWHPWKLARAVAALEGSAAVPTLYASGLTVVDAALRQRGAGRRPGRRLGFANALVECPLHGCTMVLNGRARSLVAEYIPESAMSHDWWVYLVVAAFGRVIYDPTPTLLYRRHAGAVTWQAGSVATWAMRCRRFLELGPQRAVYRQADAFGSVFGARLAPELRAILDRFLGGSGSFASRLSYAMRAEVYRQAPIDNLVLRVQLLTAHL